MVDPHLVMQKKMQSSGWSRWKGKLREEVWRAHEYVMMVSWNINARVRFSSQSCLYAVGMAGFINHLGFRIAVSQTMSRLKNPVGLCSNGVQMECKPIRSNEYPCRSHQRLSTHPFSLCLDRLRVVCNSSWMSKQNGNGTCLHTSFTGFLLPSPCLLTLACFLVVWNRSICFAACNFTWFPFLVSKIGLGSLVSMTIFESFHGMYAPGAMASRTPTSHTLQRQRCAGGKVGGTVYCIQFVFSLYYAMRQTCLFLTPTFRCSFFADSVIGSFGLHSDTVSGFSGPAFAAKPLLPPWPQRRWFRLSWGGWRTARCNWVEFEWWDILVNRLLNFFLDQAFVSSWDIEFSKQQFSKHNLRWLVVW